MALSKRDLIERVYIPKGPPTLIPNNSCTTGKPNFSCTSIRRCHGTKFGLCAQSITLEYMQCFKSRLTPQTTFLCLLFCWQKLGTSQGDCAHTHTCHKVITSSSRRQNTSKQGCTTHDCSGEGLPTYNHSWFEDMQNRKHHVANYRANIGKHAKPNPCVARQC